MRRYSQVGEDINVRVRVFRDAWGISGRVQVMLEGRGECGGTTGRGRRFEAGESGGRYLQERGYTESRLEAIETSEAQPFHHSLLLKVCSDADTCATYPS